MSQSGSVFNIQRFSIHDGPGIRTTVFLKGCSLSCFWCHNPEGRRVHPELQFFPEKCIACGACVAACPHMAHEFIAGVHVFHRDRCETSGACIATCYSQALQLSSETMSVDQVMVEISRDEAFYRSSGGGITLSGGEPGLNRPFSYEILRQCKSRNFHTAIETCGECPWESLEGLLPVTDLVMMDIKQFRPEKHREATGKSNERIVENARRLSLTNTPLVFRTPVVPTVNDSVEDIREIAAFLYELTKLRKTESNGQGAAALSYELLPFHRLAADKYRSLGIEYKAAALQPPTKEQMQRLAEVARGCGIETTAR
jgi:pyruvate formate lyase activating enzyme